jgi:hypothetical protein
MHAGQAPASFPASVLFTVNNAVESWGRLPPLYKKIFNFLNAAFILFVVLFFIHYRRLLGPPAC